MENSSKTALSRKIIFHKSETSQRLYFSDLAHESWNFPTRYFWRSYGCVFQWKDQVYDPKIKISIIILVIKSDSNPGKPEFRIIFRMSSEVSTKKVQNTVKSHACYLHWAVFRESEWIASSWRTLCLKLRLFLIYIPTHQKSWLQLNYLIKW